MAQHESPTPLEFDFELDTKGSPRTPKNSPRPLKDPQTSTHIYIYIYIRIYTLIFDLEYINIRRDMFLLFCMTSSRNKSSMSSPCQAEHILGMALNLALPGDIGGELYSVRVPALAFLFGVLLGV